MPNVDCIVFYERKGVEVKSLPVEDNKVKITDSWQPSFSLSDFIPEIVNKSRWEFWRRSTGRQFLVLREGVNKAIEPTGIKFDEHWGEDEAKKAIAKFITQALETQKPFSNWQVIGIMASIGVLAVLQIILLMRFY